MTFWAVPDFCCLEAKQIITASSNLFFLYGWWGGGDDIFIMVNAQPLLQVILSKRDFVSVHS